MAERNRYIQTAYELKMLSADEQKRLAYEERLKAERDYVSFANDNWRRGREEGFSEGKEEGLSEGRKEGIQGERFRIVRNMLKNGMSDEMVTKSVDCTKEELEYVKGQLQSMEE